MQQTPSANVVVDYGSTKQAALFFDYVIPYDGVEGYRVFDRDFNANGNQQRARDIIRRLLPPDIGTDAEVTDFASAAAIGLSLIAAAVGFYNCEPANERADELFAQMSAPTGLSRYMELETPTTVDRRCFTLRAEGEEESAVLSIAGIQVPDVANLDWDLILEFRKEPQARMRLRRLRVFAAKEYSGKSRAFIEDDLCVRKEEYDQTLKAWGIRTVLGVLSTALSVESALKLGIANAVGLLCGLSGPAALATSLAVPCSHFAVELAKARLERQNEVDKFPLAYVMDLSRLVDDVGARTSTFKDEVPPIGLL